MKEMIYKEDCTLELLEYNSYKGFNYAVISIGIFPTAYVEIPKDHPYYLKPHTECDIKCHGGLMFSGKLKKDFDLPSNTYWLGWYYGHYEDLLGSDLQFRDISAGIAYTTKDIVNECEIVIDQLLEVTK